jgi:hypothetical protein
MPLGCFAEDLFDVTIGDVWNDCTCDPLMMCLCAYVCHALIQAGADRAGTFVTAILAQLLGASHGSCHAAAIQLLPTYLASEQGSTSEQDAAGGMLPRRTDAREELIDLCRATIARIRAECETGARGRQSEDLSGWQTAPGDDHAPRPKRGDGAGSGGAAAMRFVAEAVTVLLRERAGPGGPPSEAQAGLGTSWEDAALDAILEDAAAAALAGARGAREGSQSQQLAAALLPAFATPGAPPRFHARVVATALALAGPPDAARAATSGEGSPASCRRADPAGALALLARCPAALAALGPRAGAGGVSPEAGLSEAALEALLCAGVADRSATVRKRAVFLVRALSRTGDGPASEPRLLLGRVGWDAAQWDMFLSIHAAAEDSSSHLVSAAWGCVGELLPRPGAAGGAGAAAQARWLAALVALGVRHRSVVFRRECLEWLCGAAPALALTQAFMEDVVLFCMDDPQELPQAA